MRHITATPNASTGLPRGWVLLGAATVSWAVLLGLGLAVAQTFNWLVSAV